MHLEPLAQRNLTPWDSSSQLFCGISPNFRERGMIMRHGRKFMNGHSLVHCSNDFMDQFSSKWAETGATNDLAARGIGEQFHEAIQGLHDH